MCECWSYSWGGRGRNIGGTTSGLRTSLSEQKPAMVVKICFHCTTSLCTECALDVFSKRAIDTSIVQLNLEAHHEQMVDWFHSV